MDMKDDSHILPLYLQYNRLTAKTLGKLLTDMGNMADIAVQAYSLRVAGSSRVPSLEIDTVLTGDSIKFTFGEGWLPSISTDRNHDIVINTPRKLGIPLLVGYLMLGAAEKVLDIHSKVLDDRIKQIEVKLKQEELNKIVTSDQETMAQLVRQSVDTLNQVVNNEDIIIFRIYDIDIVNRMDKRIYSRMKDPGIERDPHEL